MDIITFQNYPLLLQIIQRIAQIMSLQQLAQNMDFSLLQKQMQQKRSFVTQQREKLVKQIDQKISNIILVKKRKLQYNNYIQAAERLKLFLTASRNLVDVYFTLLDDEEKYLLYNFTDYKDLVAKFRFCLFRSIHNMNRMLIKQTQSSSNQQKSSSGSQIPSEENKKQGSQKKKKRKKGKNSKMSIEQTGCMYKWILENFENPYPSQQQKEKLSADSKISISKVNYWFINMRERTLKKLMSGENSGCSKKKKTGDKSGHEREFDFSDQESQMIEESSSEEEN